MANKVGSDALRSAALDEITALKAARAPGTLSVINYRVHQVFFTALSQAAARE